MSGPVEFTWGGGGRKQRKPSVPREKVVDHLATRLAEEWVDNIIGWVLLVLAFRVGGPVLAWVLGARSVPFPFLPSLMDPLIPGLPQRWAWIIAFLLGTHVAMMWFTRRLPQHLYRRVYVATVGGVLTAIVGDGTARLSLSDRLKGWRRARATAGTVRGLRHLRDPQDRALALHMLHVAVERCAPSNRSDARAIDLQPRAVLAIRQSPTSTEIVVRHSGVVGIADEWEKLGPGLAAALPGKLATGDVRVRKDDGDASVVIVRVTHSAPVQVGVPKVADGRSITAGVDIGATPDGQRVVLPIYEQHWLVSGASGMGKSTVLTVAAQQISASKDAVVWVLDMQGALSDLEPFATRYASTHAECVQMIRDLRSTVMEERNAMLRKLGVRKLLPSQAPVVWLLADELPGILGRDKSLKAELTMVMREGRKLGVSVAIATQQGIADAVPTEITSQAMTVVGLGCRTPKESENVLGSWHVAGWRLERLREPGQAIVTTPSLREPIYCRVHDLSDGIASAPVRPTAWPPPSPLSDGVSRDLSDGVSGGRDTGPEQDIGAAPTEGVSDVSGGPTPPRSERHRRIADRLGQAGEWGLSATELADTTRLKRPTIIADIAKWEGPGEIVQGVDKRFRIVGVASDHTVDA